MPEYGAMAMKKVFRLGHRVGLCSMWYAKPNIGFLKPGLYLWLFNRNVRIVPMQNKSRNDN